MEKTIMTRTPGSTMRSTRMCSDIVRRALIATMLCALIFPSFAWAGITAKEIIENVQARYASLNDVVITFTQTVRFKVSKAEQQSKGVLYFKKANKYRIESENRTVLTDGKTSWSYNAQTNQVVVDRYKQAAHSLSPEQLLVKYPQNYFSTLIGEEKVGSDDCYVLKLTPKEDNSFASAMKIWVSGKWMIRKVEITDMNGALTTYLIEQLTIDKGVPDSKFDFKVPAGADVIDLR